VHKKRKKGETSLIYYIYIYKVCTTVVQNMHCASWYVVRGG